MSWIEYWNGNPTIYVSQRHQLAHDANIAQSIIPYIPHSEARVFDYGCGDATSSALIARHCGALYLWDAAEAVRGRLTRRFEGNKKINVLSDRSATCLESGSMDLITIVSVVQYMDDQSISELLLESRRLLSPSGKLLIADVIPPGVGIARDAEQLIRFGLKQRFAGAAVLGLAKTALSGYIKLRSTLNLRNIRLQRLSRF